MSTELSEKEGWPYFLVKSCSNGACITAIPCCDESKARCCSTGAATGQRKITEFLPTSGPFLKGQVSGSCFHLALPALFGSESISQFLWCCNFKGSWFLSLAPTFLSLFLPFFLGIFQATVFLACSTRQTRPGIHITIGLTCPYP